MFWIRTGNLPYTNQKHYSFRQPVCLFPCRRAVTNTFCFQGEHIEITGEARSMTKWLINCFDVFIATSRLELSFSTKMFVTTTTNTVTILRNLYYILGVGWHCVWNWDFCWAHRALRRDDRWTHSTGGMILTRENRNTSEQILSLCSSFGKHKINTDGFGKDSGTSRWEARRLTAWVRSRPWMHPW